MVGKDTWYYISFLWIYWDLLCSSACGSSWRILHMSLKRMCILLLLDGILYKNELCPSSLMCHLDLWFLINKECILNCILSLKFLYWIVMSSLYILNINSLYQKYLLQIFSFSRLIFSLLVSFALQRILVWYSHIYLFFYFVAVAGLLI